MTATIKINAVRNLSDREFDAMKAGTPIDRIMRVYVGRQWNNRKRNGRSLKASPLGNPFSVKRFGEKGSFFKYKLWIFFDDSPMIELDRISSLCTQHDVIVLVCHCVKSEDDSETPCHARIIRKVLEERMKREET